MPKLNSFRDTLNRYFPNAELSRVLVKKFLIRVHTEYRLPAKEIVHADSVCSDDLNNVQYPPEAREMLGPFTLGGLDGFPFAGVTGMGAFAHHVPAGGGVLIFYGPHIGITKDGVLGKVLRPGQPEASSCCGAAQAALNKLEAGHIISCDLTSLDYQQNTIEQIFLQRKHEIVGLAVPPIVAATRAMFAATRERMEILIKKTDFHGARHVFTAGGIVINSDAAGGQDGESYIQPLDFSHWNPKTYQRQDILPQVQATVI